MTDTRKTDTAAADLQARLAAAYDQGRRAALASTRRNELEERLAAERAGHGPFTDTYWAFRNGYKQAPR